MDRLILTDSREAYTVNELDAHEGWAEYQEWLRLVAPMDAWIESMDGYGDDLFGYEYDQPEWME